MSGEPDRGKLWQECKLDIAHAENERVLSKVTLSLTNSILCSYCCVCYFLSVCYHGSHGSMLSSSSQLSRMTPRVITEAEGLAF